MKLLALFSLMPLFWQGNAQDETFFIQMKQNTSIGLGLVSWRADRIQAEKRLRTYSFGDFVREFDRTYEHGSEEWTRRERVFNASLEEILAFQMGPEQSWTKGITKFMDYSPTEFRALLGYRGRGGSRRPPPSNSISVFRSNPATAVPGRVLLRKDPDSLLSLVRNQGMCGSCWAQAATSVLEGVMEKHAQVLTKMMEALNGTQKFATLSTQTMVSCTPNPQHCGGTGGCDGNTAELGYDMIMKRGMPLAVTWGYTSGHGNTTPACRDDVFSKVRLGITGYTVLPSNKLDPLKEALFTTGAPIVVTVDASSWSFYHGGVYSDTADRKKGEFEVNHAVTLMGYQEGEAKTVGYWLIKNSWGLTWGEFGYIRLEMKTDEESHCGWDHKTQDGVACDGDPDTAWVCGTCGVLYDSSFPTGPYVIEP